MGTKGCIAKRGCNQFFTIARRAADFAGQSEAMAKSIVANTPPARLDARPHGFRFEPPGLRPQSRLGRPSSHRAHRCLGDQLDQPFACIGTVAFLRAVALRGQHQHAVAGQPAPRKPHQPHCNVIGQVRRPPHIEAQLHRGRDLVDVLPSHCGFSSMISIMYGLCTTCLDVRAHAFTFKTLQLGCPRHLGRTTFHRGNLRFGDEGN